MVSATALQKHATNDAEHALDISGDQGVTLDMRKGFARKARERLRLDDDGYRRDHLRALAQRVVVADAEVRNGIEVGITTNAGRRFKRRNGGVQRS